MTRYYYETPSRLGSFFAANDEEALKVRESIPTIELIYVEESLNNMRIVWQPES